MQQAGCVRGSKGAADLFADGRGLGGAESSLLFQQLRQGLAVDQLAPHADAAVVFGQAVHGHDVRMAQLRQQPSLGFQVRLCADGLVQELECDFAIEGGVPGAIDLAESAGANPLANLQMPPGLERRWSSPARVVRSPLPAERVSSVAFEGSTFDPWRGG